MVLSSSHAGNRTTPLPATGPVAASKTRQIVPFHTPLISLCMYPLAGSEIRTIVMNPSFHIPFQVYRDMLPLMPGTKPSSLPTDEAAVDGLAKTIYTMMDTMYTCTYDRPLSVSMAKFSSNQHIECLIYQACRNLARPEEPFGDFFKRERLSNKPGRAQATNKIKALIMVIHNLILAYTVLPPCDLVREMEKGFPSKEPKLSPIPEVRRKATLVGMDIGTLRKQVIDTERKGQDEKEWLVNKLMHKQSLASSQIEVIKVDEYEKGSKRGNDTNGGGEDDKAKKRVRTG